METLLQFASAYLLKSRDIYVAAFGIFSIGFLVIGCVVLFIADAGNFEQILL
ncbi:MAG: hypothetical protein GX452_01200 [Ignavibacteriales bacterium]|jgi:hypothetical protein|nr:hypothetical protein [Ignavibacteriaceae bacterium]NLH60003.1 hypothetical protein [Ignavibacteriales bacterium]HOJ17974.1 hypothetical protein [Ignavibacteriaceae bacterium]